MMAWRLYAGDPGGDRGHRVWHIAVLALVLGIVTSFDAPARMSLTVGNG